jgi:hypothetical protein
MPAMWPPDFEPCHDLSAAEWIAPRLLPWGTGMGTPVTSVVPVGFDAYVRVFHPAGAPAPAETATWQEVADWSGGTFHPLAQFERMSIPLMPDPSPPPFDQAPGQGNLMPALCDLLVRQPRPLAISPSGTARASWSVAGPAPGTAVAPLAGGVAGPVAGGLAGPVSGRCATPMMGLTPSILRSRASKRK